MKVSIITACFNSASTIEDTLRSVDEQTYANLEHIIVDGSSTDNTLEVVKRYGQRISQIISEPDRGIYDAMNKGIRAATGEVVGILNSDDILDSASTISEIAARFDDATDGVYGDLSYFKGNDKDRITRFYDSSNFKNWKIRFGMMIPHPTFYVRKASYEQLGLYKLTYRVSADFELIARFIKQGAHLKRIPKTLVKMRQGGISTTGFWWRVHQNMEIVRACRENGIYTNLGLVALKAPSKILSLLNK